MKISKIQKILNEYNKSGQKMTTLAAPGGDKASGKNYDNMLVGKSEHYKVTNTDTQYMQMFPALGRLVKSVKDDEMGGKKLVINPLIIQNLKDLNKISKFKKDEEGNFILPFGDGIRLEKQNGKFFITNKKKEKESLSDISDENLTDIFL